MQENLSKAYSALLTPKINSKTEALTYAIEVTKTADGLHLDKAEQVFRMFVDNIELPDVAAEPASYFYKQATDAVTGVCDELKKRLHSDDNEKEHEEETTTEAVQETGTTVETEIEKQQGK